MFLQYESMSNSWNRAQECVYVPLQSSYKWTCDYPGFGLFFRDEFNKVSRARREIRVIIHIRTRVYLYMHSIHVCVCAYIFFRFIFFNLSKTVFWFVELFSVHLFLVYTFRINKTRNTSINITCFCVDLFVNTMCVYSTQN